MDNRVQGESDREIITRIIATLFSLAKLAELASGAPHPVRIFVLWLLRRTEHAARGLLGDDMLDEMAEDPQSVSAGNEPADALILAASLRTLALALQIEMDEDALFAAWWRNGGECAQEKLDFVIQPAKRRDPVTVKALARRCRSLMAGLALVPRLDTS